MSSCAVVSNSLSWEPKTLHEKVEWCYIRILISVKRLNFERELFLVISSCKYHFNLLLDLSFKSLTDLFLWICCLKATSRLEEHLINCCELWKSVSDLRIFFFPFFLRFTGIQKATVWTSETPSKISRFCHRYDLSTLYKYINICINIRTYILQFGVDESLRRFSFWIRLYYLTGVPWDFKQHVITEEIGRQKERDIVSLLRTSPIWLRKRII